jgi:hypothetical protein
MSYPICVTETPRERTAATNRSKSQAVDLLLKHDAAVSASPDQPAQRSRVPDHSSPREFLESHEWLAFRYAQLRAADFTCRSCGRSPVYHGVVLYVHHVKPLWTRFELRLDPSNVVVRCEECRRGRHGGRRFTYSDANQQLLLPLLGP